jgi:hypothetical protein
MNRKSVKFLHFVKMFNNLSMFNISFGFGAVEAGAESLRICFHQNDAARAPEHCKAFFKIQFWG